jgi:hypothetical protein
MHPPYNVTRERPLNGNPTAVAFPIVMHLPPYHKAPSSFLEHIHLSLSFVRLTLTSRVLFRLHETLPMLAVAISHISNVHVKRSCRAMLKLKLRSSR